ncbi:GLPGLI family protein [Halpernia frigidisoli]|uniref:GLPGLI family protein n=1 Tax=Halpernia frigidisoli TaxID=1125876 RepID=A0A1I3IHI8_9FLAO|nr:GLPGLI family protein [Halpernia frigidisoli]SFI47392.1 GLPGLI family protein [Halpernia frigidisoli]
MSGKNKLLFVFLILFLNTIVAAQEFRVMYNYSFKKDSTNNFVESEMMVLDTEDKGSVFYSYPKYKYDSISIAKHKKNENVVEADNSKIQFFVEKKYPNFELVFHTTLGSTNYAVNDSTKIKWKLEPERKILKGFPVQKAIANFGNRDWVAWYSKEIPINDGPFKFFGLPGLILEIEDSKSNHKFEFLGIEKNSYGYNNFFKINKLNEKELSSEDFNKQWKIYKKDPAKDTKFSLLNSKLGYSINYDGKDYSISDMIRIEEERQKEKIKRDNNFIELSLYK